MPHVTRNMMPFGVGLLFLLWGNVSSAASQPSAPTVMMRVRNSSMCLEAGTTRMLQRACDNNRGAQKWHLTKIADTASGSTYEIKSAANARCLDAPSGRNYFQLLNRCHRGPVQQWEFDLPRGLSAAQVESRDYGLVIKNVRQQTYVGGDELIRPDAEVMAHELDVIASTFAQPMVALQNTLDIGSCMDVPGASMAADWVNGAYACNYGLNQHWELQPQGNNQFSIRANHSGMCLDVPNSGDSLVQQFSCHSGTNQLFGMRMVGDDIYEIKTSDQRCLQIGTTEDSSWLVASSWCGNDTETSQLWRPATLSQFTGQTFTPNVSSARTRAAFGNNAWLNFVQLLALLGDRNAIGLTGHYEGDLCSGNSCTRVAMNLSHPNTLVSGRYEVTGVLRTMSDSLTLDPGLLCPNITIPSAIVPMAASGTGRLSASGALSHSISGLLGISGSVTVNYTATLNASNYESLDVRVNVVTPSPCANIAISGTLRRTHYDF